MNDRYLFRAKHSLESKKWNIGNLVEEPDGLYLRDNKNNIMVYIQDTSTICQCTGLKDKNGKLIWENDIVDGHVKRGAAFYRCKVLWNECKARFDVMAMECNFPMTLDECTDDISICGLDYEVIGNIFDNPELINE